MRRLKIKQMKNPLMTLAFVLLMVLGILFHTTISAFAAREIQTINDDFFDTHGLLLLVNDGDSFSDLSGGSNLANRSKWDEYKSTESSKTYDNIGTFDGKAIGVKVTTTPIGDSGYQMAVKFANGVFVRGMVDLTYEYYYMDSPNEFIDMHHALMSIGSLGDWDGGDDNEFAAPVSNSSSPFYVWEDTALIVKTFGSTEMIGAAARNSFVDEPDDPSYVKSTVWFDMQGTANTVRVYSNNRMYSWPTFWLTPNTYMGPNGYAPEPSIAIRAKVVGSYPDGGTITDEGDTSLLIGQSKSYTAQAANGYRIKDIKAVKGSLNGTGKTSILNSYINKTGNSTSKITIDDYFYRLEQDGYIEVEFEPNTINVAYAWDGQAPAGKTVPAGGEKQYGSSYTVDTTYKKNDTVEATNVTYGGKTYARGTWTFQGWDQTGTITLNERNKGYTETNPDRTITIKGKWTFTPAWNITTEVVNGTIDPNITNIPDKESRTIKYSPNNGYLLSEIIVDGNNVNIANNPNSYPFNNITADHHIKVVYEKQPDPTKVVQNTSGTNIHQQIVNKGETLVYKVTVKNPTKVAKRYTITDAIPDNTALVANSISDSGSVSGKTITWSNLSVAANAEKTVTFQVTTNADGVRIDNKAHMRISEYGNTIDKDTNTVTNWTPVPPTKEVLDSDGDNTHKMMRTAGQELTYKITIKNPSNLTKSFTVTDTLPNGLNATSIDGATQNGQTLTWTFNLNGGASRTLTVKATVLDSAKDTVLDNKAKLVVDLADLDTPPVETPIFKDPVKTVTRNGEDINGMLVNKHGEQVFQDAELTRTVDSVLTYTISWHNPARDAKTFTVTDILPTTCDLVEGSISDGGTFENGKIIWQITVPAGESKEVSFDMTPNATNIYIPNKASVAVDKVSLDTNTVENWVPEPIKKLVTDEEGNPIPYHEIRIKDNRQLTYEIRYANNSSLEKVFTITDPLPKGVEFVASEDGGVYDEATNTVTWTRTVPAGGRGSVFFDFKVTEEALEADDPTTLRNVAYVTSDLWDDYEPEYNIFDVPQERRIPVQKVWEDEDDKTGERPDYVVVELYDEATSQTISSIRLDGKNNWSGEFVITGGDEILTKNYAVREATQPAGYKSAVSGSDDANGFTLTNTLMKPVAEKDVFNEENISIDGEFVQRGQILTYELSWTNVYDEAQIVRFEDTIPDETEFVSVPEEHHGRYDEHTRTVFWKVDNVEPGETATVSFTVKVKDSAAGSIKNTGIVTVNGSRMYTNTTENDPAPEPTKDILDAEGASMNGKEVTIGDVLRYEVKVDNDSATDRTYTITDVIPEGTEFVAAEDGGEEADGIITWTVDVKARESASVHFTVKVATDAIVSIDNEAKVQIGPNESDYVYTNKTQNPPTDPPMTPPVKDVLNEEGVSIDKEKVSFGDILTYTITFTNPSDNARNFIVTDTVPEGTSFISADNDGKEAEGTVTWEIQAEGRKDVTVSFQVKVERGAPALITNTGYVQRLIPTIVPAGPDEPDGETTEEQVPDGEPIPTNEVENPTPQPEEIPETPILGKQVTVYKEAVPVSGTKVGTDDEIRYLFTATNTGASTSGYTVIRDYIPAGTEYVEGSVTENGVYVAATENSKAYVEFIISGIAPNASYEGEIGFTVKVTKDAAGVIANHALHQTFDEDPGNPGDERPDPELPTNEVYHPTDDTPAPAEIQVIKDSVPAPGSIVKENDVITYKLQVTNTGGSDAKSVVIRDDVPSGTTFVESDGTEKAGTIQWHFDQIAVGETKDLTFKVKVNKDAPEIILNQARFADNFDPNEKNDPQNTTNIVEHPTDISKDQPILGSQVTVYKTSDPAPNSVVKPGEQITYILKAVNTGEKISGYTVIRDTIPTGTTYVEGSSTEGGVFVPADGATKAYVEWVISGIEPNKEYKAPLTYAVTVNENTVGLIKNVAVFKTTEEDPGKPGETTITPDLPTNPVYHTTDEDIPTPAVIEVVKTSNPAPGSKVKQGEDILYTLTVQNTGGSDAKSVVVRDTIPEMATYVADSAKDGSYDRITDRVQWLIPTLEAGHEAKLTFKATVKVDATTLVQNQARYEDNFDPEDPKTPKNSTNIVEHPIEIVEKDPATPIKRVLDTAGRDINKAAVTVGDTLVYEITAINAEDKAQTMTITDTVPKGTKFISAAGYSPLASEADVKAADGVENKGTITWTVTIPAKGTAKVFMRVEVTDASQKAIKNVATVTDENGRETKTNEVENTPKAKEDPKATPTPTPAVTNTPAISSGAKTSDASPIPFVLAGAGLAVAAAALWIRRRKNA